MAQLPTSRRCEADIKKEWKEFFDTAPGALRLVVVTTGIKDQEFYNQFNSAAGAFPGMVSTVSFDASSCPKIIKSFNLHSLPAVLVFRGRRLVEKWMGLNYKKDNIQKAIGRFSALLGVPPRFATAPTRRMLPAVPGRPSYGPTTAVTTYPTRTYPTRTYPATPQPRQQVAVPAASIGPMGYDLSETLQESSATSRWLNIINAERSRYGLPALKRNRSLEKTARFYAMDMGKRGYYSHYSPEGKDVSDRLRMITETYNLAPPVNWAAIGENIDKDEATPEAVHASLMNSPQHRENILRSNFTDIGLGFYAPTRHWVQVFAQVR